MTNINVGPAANTGDGDNLRQAFIIVNSNFDETELLLNEKLDNTDLVSINNSIDGKADLVHTHTISQVNGLTSSLASKADRTELNNEISNINNTISNVNSILMAKVGTASATNTGILLSTDWITFNNKQNALGYTPENVVNKSTNVITDRTSNTKYASVKAVYDWSVGTFTQSYIIPSLTSTQRDNLGTPSNGYQIFNTTESYMEYYDSFWGWMPVANQNEWKRKWGSEYFNDFGVNNGGINDGVFQSFPVNGGAANITTGAPTTGFIGYQGLSTGLASNGQSALRTDLNVGRFFLTNVRTSFISRVFIPTLSNATDRFNFIFGLSSNTNSTINSGVSFIYDEGGVGTGTTATPNWQIITANQSVRTNIVTNVAVIANTWYSLRIESNSTFTELYYYINDVLVRTETTNIPTGFSNIIPIISITKTVGTSSRGLAVDYLGYKIKLNAIR